MQLEALDWDLLSVVRRATGTPCSGAWAMGRGVALQPVLRGLYPLCPGRHCLDVVQLPPSARLVASCRAPSRRLLDLRSAILRVVGSSQCAGDLKMHNNSTFHVLRNKNLEKKIKISK